MKFKSHVFAQASGSVAGITYSHNKGGMYTRSRSIPVNPATAAQQIARNALKTLAARWSSTVSATNRAGWADYAANVPILNKLGEPRPIPPLAMYLRCNSPRQQNGAGIIDTPPTIFSLATFSVSSVGSLANVLQVNFTNSDEWATATGGYMFVYVSRAQNPTINFWKGPYSAYGIIAGDTMTPPASPHNFTGAPAIVTGLKYFVRINVTNADGRLSSSQTFDLIGA